MNGGNARGQRQKEVTSKETYICVWSMSMAMYWGRVRWVPGEYGAALRTSTKRIRRLSLGISFFLVVWFDFEFLSFFFCVSSRRKSIERKLEERGRAARNRGEWRQATVSMNFSEGMKQFVPRRTKQKGRMAESALRQCLWAYRIACFFCFCSHH